MPRYIDADEFQKAIEEKAKRLKNLDTIISLRRLSAVLVCFRAALSNRDDEMINEIVLLGITFYMPIFLLLDWEG